VLSVGAGHAVAHQQLGADIAFDPVHGIFGHFLEILQITRRIERFVTLHDSLSFRPCQSYPMPRSDGVEGIGS
jgi:hypothetical protein